MKGFQPFVEQYSWLGVFIHDSREVDSSQRFPKGMHLIGAKGAFMLAYIRDAGQLTQVVSSIATGTKTSTTVLRLGE